MGLEVPNSNPQNESAAKYGTKLYFLCAAEIHVDSPHQSTKMEQTKLAHKKKIKRKY